MHPHGVEILHVADRETVVLVVPHHFILDLFPFPNVLFNQDLSDHALSKSPANNLFQLLFAVGHSRAFPSESIRHP